MKHRDFQRERVYAWERGVASAEGRALGEATWSSISEVEAWLAPIWKAERGRYGNANVPAPVITHASWGQRRALAHHGAWKISLPRWARSPWVATHELAHLLIRARDPWHGPRFVGTLIGLASRHLGFDAYELMRSADAAGVEYYVRSIGSVPVRGTQWRAEQALAKEGPMSAMDLACWLSLATYHDPVTWRQVHGAMLGSIRAGRVRLFRGKYQLQAVAVQGAGG
jgi:putative metallohydrolase (TIGR04338 family)